MRFKCPCCGEDAGAVQGVCCLVCFHALRTYYDKVSIWCSLHRRVFKDPRVQPLRGQL